MTPPRVRCCVDGLWHLVERSDGTWAGTDAYGDLGGFGLSDPYTLAAAMDESFAVEPSRGTCALSDAPVGSLAVNGDRVAVKLSQGDGDPDWEVWGWTDAEDDLLRADDMDGWRVFHVHKS